MSFCRHTFHNIKYTVISFFQIPGTDGKAGMATIVDANDTLDVSDLGKALSADLPHYALPIFLRVAKKIDMTSECHCLMPQTLFH